MVQHETPKAKTPAVAIIMGSESDFPVMKAAAEALRDLGVHFHMQVISAHRMPREMADFARDARENGFKVIIAGAGGAAHLPGMVAAHTTLPVIGVPVPHGPLQGQDALYSIVQMPKGVPVATVAIGGAYNAGLLSAQMLSVGEDGEAQELARKLDSLKESMQRAAQGMVLPSVT
jgi:5-(carboxyamino)imidazole ribonucleotide mutase